MIHVNDNPVISPCWKKNQKKKPKEKPTPLPKKTKTNQTKKRVHILLVKSDRNNVYCKETKSYEIPKLQLCVRICYLPKLSWVSEEQKKGKKIKNPGVTQRTTYH